MRKNCLLVAVKKIAVVDLVIAFVVYLLPFILHICKENGNSGCGIRNFHFTWGSPSVKKFLKPIFYSFQTLPSNIQWLLILTVLTINFTRMFWQSISLLRATVLQEVNTLKIWIILEAIGSIFTYAVLLNPWIFAWRNVFLYSSIVISVSVYKIFSIFPIVIFKYYIQMRKNTSSQELTTEAEETSSSCLDDNDEGEGNEAETVT